MKCHQCGKDLSKQTNKVLRFCPHCGAPQKTPSKTLEDASSPGESSSPPSPSKASSSKKGMAAQTAFFAPTPELQNIQMQEEATSSSPSLPGLSLSQQDNRSTLAFEAANISEVLASLNSTMETGPPAEDEDTLDEDSLIASESAERPILGLEPPPKSRFSTTVETPAKKKPTTPFKAKAPAPTPSPATVSAPSANKATLVFEQASLPIEPPKKETPPKPKPVIAPPPPVGTETDAKAGKPDTTEETAKPVQKLGILDALHNKTQENKAKSEDDDRGARIKVTEQMDALFPPRSSRPADSLFDVPSSFLEKEERELTTKDSRVIVAYNEGPATQKMAPLSPALMGGDSQQNTLKTAEPLPQKPAKAVVTQPRTSSISHAKDTVNMSLAELQNSLQDLGVELYNENPPVVDEQCEIKRAEELAANGDFEQAIETYMTLLKTNPPDRDKHQARLVELWEEWRLSGFHGADVVDFGMPPADRYRNLLIVAVLVVLALIAMVFFLQSNKKNQTPQASNVAHKGKTDSGVTPEKRAPAPRVPAKSLLMITSSPSGAEIVLNGMKIGQRTPSSLRLAPGRYKLKLQLTGFEEKERSLRMLKATNIIIDMNLRPDSGKARKKPSRRKARRLARRKITFHLQSTPSQAAIWINGRDSKKTTPAKLKLRPGSYKFELRHKGHKAVKRNFQFQPGEDLQAHIALSQNVAQLEVNSNPSGAEIWLNGEKTSYKTPASMPIPVNKEVKVELKARGYSAKADTVKLKSGENKTLTLTLKKKGPNTMAYIPGGSFWMGNNTSIHEKPMHKVTLSGFWLDRHEVTVADYMACVKEGVCTKPGVGPGCNARDAAGKAKHPINCVNWYDARKFCRWKKKRLPSEAQWEKAARASSAQPYPWGFSAPSCSKANFDKGGAGCGQGGTVAVGSKKAGRNRYGLQDMAGNVWEWVRDYYSLKYYKKSPAKNPVNRKKGSGYKVVRGGSWRTKYDKLHMTYRSEAWPSKKSPTIGFRCAK